MELQAIQATPLPATPAPAAPAQGGFAQAQAAALPSATPAYEVSVASPPLAATVNLQAADAEALAQQAVQAQQSVLSALRSGSADASVLLSGLPPGATATLLGGGWARLPQGMDAVEAEAIWSFHFPYRRRETTQVRQSPRTEPAGEQERGRSGGLARRYGSKGQGEPEPEADEGHTLDILD